MIHLDTIRSLRTARAKVEQGWCQNVMAVDAEGDRTQTLSRDACAWCLLGALDLGVKSHCTSLPEIEQYAEISHQVLVMAYESIRALGWEIEAGEIEKWNDHASRTQTEVLAALDHAIIMAEEKRRKHESVSASYQ